MVAVCTFIVNILASLYSIMITSLAKTKCLCHSITKTRNVGLIVTLWLVSTYSSSIFLLLRSATAATNTPTGTATAATTTTTGSVRLSIDWKVPLIVVLGTLLLACVGGGVYLAAIWLKPKARYQYVSSMAPKEKKEKKRKRKEKKKKKEKRKKERLLIHL